MRTDDVDCFFLILPDPSLLFFTALRGVRTSLPLPMETARDLNMETDEIQLVVSALRGVGKRIVEVAQTHKPLFAGELFLTGKEVCERLYISPRTLQDYRDRKIIPYTQFAGKILYKASDLERMLEENYYFKSI